MDLPSQSSEEEEQHPHAAEETLLPSSPAAESHPEEARHVDPVSEDVPTLPTLASDPLAEEPQHTDLVGDDAPTLLASTSEPLAEETESQPTSSFDEDGDEDEDLELEGASPAQPGVFVSRGVLIAVACAVVIVALLATLLVVVTRPKDPPTDWIASYTPAAGTSSTTGKIVYYLHWKNQNGALQGQLQLATFSNGALQSATAPTTGLYSKDNHIIYVVVTLNGQASTLTGNINDAGDILTLNAPGAASPGSGLVFHTGSANDYKQETKKLGPAK
jgi:hypothetical protein